ARGCGDRRPLRRWFRYPPLAARGSRRRRKGPDWLLLLESLSRSHLLDGHAPGAARTVGHVACELPAGGRDIVAARLARRYRDAGALQDLGEAADALGA